MTLPPLAGIPEPAPRVSVVVIGRNEGERLARCLNSVFAMDASPGAYEVIYVDSASTDGSPERAAARGVRVIPLNAPRPSAALARNAGWRASRAECILFLDGDTILHPAFLTRALAALERPGTAVVFGRRQEIDPQKSVYHLVLDLDWNGAAGPVAYCGGDALMRREALVAVDGYDERLIAGEEPELCRRLRAARYEIYSLDTPMTLHDLAMARWAQYWKRAMRTGHAYAEVASRFWRTDDPLWKNEVRKNLLQGALYLALPLVAAAAALVLRSVLPVLLVVAAFLGLIVRTAVRASLAAHSPRTRLLYGLHSHIQHIPLLFGQLGYWAGRWSGSRRALVEYK